MAEPTPIQARLMVVKGARRGEHFTLSSDAPYVIGRGSTCNLQLIDRGLSRNHLRIEYGSAGFVVSDLNSSNGTFVNGVEISSVSLSDGDILTLGETEIRFSNIATKDESQVFGEIVEDPDEEKSTRIKKRFDPGQTTILKLPEKIGDVAEYQRVNERLGFLYKITNLINAEVDLQDLFEVVIDNVMDLTKAERGYIVMRDQETGAISPVIARKSERVPENQRATISSTILRESIDHGLSVLTVDASADKRFGAGESIVMGKIKSVLCVPIEAHDQILGAMYVDTVSRTVPFTEDDLELLTVVGKGAGNAIRRVRLLEDIEAQFSSTVKTLVAAIDAKDNYTHGHSERVAMYSVQIATALGMQGTDLDTVRLAGLFHDIGKIGIPERVLNKPGRLTDEEFEIIKQHPVIGARILENIQRIKGLIVGAKYHHEKWDGRGYPDGLAGNDIPLIARIVAVADAFDAMTSNRSYRCALPMETVIAEFSKHSGSQFDKDIAEVTLRLMREGEFYPREVDTADFEYVN